MRGLTIAVGAFLLLLLSGTVYSAEEAPEEKYATREEYQKLKKQLDDVQKQLKEKSAQAPEAATQPKAAPAPAAEPAEVNERLDDLESRLKKVAAEVQRGKIGSTSFLLTGYGQAGLTNLETAPSTFFASFNPIFLWRFSDRLFFEGELELTPTGDGTPGSSSTDLSLEYADISYLINDYLTLGAGKFLLPFGTFNERTHPAWINKLPDRPFPYSDDVGLAQESGIGAFARGNARLCFGQVNYAAYVVNGPSLITDNANSTAGMLDRDNFVDNNNSKTVGGRVGYLPVPGVEAGYSISYGKVSPAGFQKVFAFLQGVDLEVTREVSFLRGSVDGRAEWVFSHLDKATYSDSTGALAPVTFSNTRNAAYAQLAYRPNLLANKVLKNFEVVGRYDILVVPNNAPGSNDEQRWTFGVDYWVTPSFVLKAAYEIDHRRGAGDQNGFLLQVGLGF